MRRTTFALTAIPGLLLAGAPPGRAEVAASAPSGFSLRIELPIAVAPAEAFNRFVQVGHWWNEAHTYSGKASNLTLETRPGGCFCETLPGGGFVKHMDVVFSAPGKTLRLAGGLGPLQDMGASGVMAFQFKAEGATTRLTMTYTAGGFATGKGYEELAPAVDGVLREQLTRFKRYAETGKPTT